MLVWILAIAAAALAGLVLYVRLAPSDPARWHVDPVAAEVPSFPGHALMRPGGPIDSPVLRMEPAALMAALDAAARAEPGTERLAGAVEDGHVTYISRSRIIGFPDYVSVRALPAEGGAQPAIFSRLRFGHDDLGVNRARVERWVAAASNGG